MAILHETELSGVDTSPGLAREFAAKALRLHHDDLVFLAQLLLSEAVTNSVLHSRSKGPNGVIKVEASVSAGRVRFSVTDAGSPTFPHTEHPSTRCDNGRGVSIIDSAAAAWGVHRDPDGATTLWFELQTETA